MEREELNREIYKSSKRRERKRKIEVFIELIPALLAFFVSSVIYGIGCFIMAHFIYKYW